MSTLPVAEQAVATWARRYAASLSPDRLAELGDAGSSRVPPAAVGEAPDYRAAVDALSADQDIRRLLTLDPSAPVLLYPPFPGSAKIAIFPDHLPMGLLLGSAFARQLEGTVVELEPLIKGVDRNVQTLRDIARGKPADMAVAAAIRGVVPPAQPIHTALGTVSALPGDRFIALATTSPTVIASTRI